MGSEMCIRDSTNIVWSVDNRTACYRIVAPNSDNVRIECRTGGADLNPYLAMAAQIAAGIAGIEQRLALEDAFNGDAYALDKASAKIPATLRDATLSLEQSTMLRQAMGDDVVDHYVRAARWEQQEFDRVVTQYEVQRGFERA